MNRRKQIGIIKYGKKLNTSKKFQSGGSISSFSGGYNWREDPYEMMLMRQKLAQESMENRRKIAAQKARYGRKGTTSTEKVNNYKPFATLKGGLAGTRAHFQNLYDSEQQSYADKLATNGNAWIATEEAKSLHSNIVKLGIKFENRLKDEKTLFDSAKVKLKDQDIDALAISNDSRMFVFDGKKYDFINVDTYIKDARSYKALSKGDFAYWQENTYNPNSDINIKDFLAGGAVGANTLNSTYIKLNRDKVKYAMIEGKLGLKNSSGGITDGYLNADQIRTGIERYIMGESPMKVGQAPTKEKSQMAGIIKEIYTGVMSGTEDQSGLTASLKAEVLKDVINRKILFDIKDDSKRQESFHKMVQVALVSKFFDSSFKLSGTSEEGKISGLGSKVKSNSVLGKLLEHTYSGNTSNNKKYVIEENGAVSIDVGKDDIVKVNSMALPLITGIVPQFKLGVSSYVTSDNKDDIREAANLGENETIGKIRSGSSIYWMNGDSMSDMFGNNNKGEGVNFLSKAVVLDPERGVDMVIMPINKVGKPIPKIARDFNSLRSVAKQEIIDAYNKHAEKGDEITTSADKLMSGNKLANNLEKDLENYNKFIEIGGEYERFKDLHDDNPNKTTEKALKRSENSRDIIKKLKTNIDILKGNGNIRLRPFAVIHVVIDADYGKGINKIMEARDKKNNTSVSSLIKKGEDYQNQFIEDLNMDSIGIGVDAYSAQMMVPIESSMVQASNKGTPEYVAGVLTLNNIEDGLIKLMEKEFIGTSPNLSTTVNFLKQI